MNTPNALKKIGGILSQLPVEKLQAAGATNPKAASTRTFRFDLPDGKASHGINRVKVTDIDGTYRIQFLKIEEVDVVGGVEPARLSEVIAKFTGIDL